MTQFCSPKILGIITRYLQIWSINWCKSKNLSWIQFFPLFSCPFFFLALTCKRWIQKCFEHVQKKKKMMQLWRQKNIRQASYLLSYAHILCAPFYVLAVFLLAQSTMPRALSPLQYHSTSIVFSALLWALSHLQVLTLCSAPFCSMRRGVFCHAIREHHLLCCAPQVNEFVVRPQASTVSFAMLFYEHYLLMSLLRYFSLWCCIKFVITPL